VARPAARIKMICSLVFNSKPWRDIYFGQQIWLI